MHCEAFWMKNSERVWLLIKVKNTHFSARNLLNQRSLRQNRLSNIHYLTPRKCAAYNESSDVSIAVELTFNYYGNVRSQESKTAIHFPVNGNDVSPLCCACTSIPPDAFDHRGSTVP